MIDFCRMGTDNKLTVPIKIRKSLGINKLKKNETIILEVNFIKAVRPTPEE